jgi:NAD(P)-dependent dehydrogenase (short-subunit alcohol dehydrogenase family)
MATAFVTGTSTGIGLATSEAVARADHHVIASMRDADRAPALAGLARRDCLPMTGHALGRGMADEDFVSRGALGIQAWCRLMETGTGLNVRKYLASG